jgi:guanylate kinase
VDIQGAEKINFKHSNWNYIFITAPSLQEIEQRIRGRGMNTE